MKLFSYSFETRILIILWKTLALNDPKKADYKTEEVLDKRYVEPYDSYLSYTNFIWILQISTRKSIAIMDNVLFYLMKVVMVKSSSERMTSFFNYACMLICESDECHWICTQN